MSDEITHVPADEVDGDEGWLRETDEPELRDVEAYRYRLNRLRRRRRPGRPEPGVRLAPGVTRSSRP